MDKQNTKMQKQNKNSEQKKNMFYLFGGNVAIYDA